VLGRTTLGHEPFHDLNEIVGREFSRRMESEAFPAVLIDEAEDAQSSAVVGAVGDKVPTPDVVEAFGSCRDDPGGAASSSPPWPPPLHPQTGVSSQPLHQLLPHRVARVVQVVHERT
jgi:hypothetical protein